MKFPSKFKIIRKEDSGTRLTRSFSGNEVKEYNNRSNFIHSDGYIMFNDYPTDKGSMLEITETGEAYTSWQ